MHPPTEPDDASLVQRLRSGDGRAWQLLVQRYERLVYTVARRGGLDGHQAADVFQIVFMRLLQHLPLIADPSRLQAWIVTTARREVANHHRQHARLVPLQDEADDDADEPSEADWRGTPDDAPGPEEALAHWQQLMRVRAALASLGAPCRRLLDMLFGTEPAGYDEISRQLGMPVGSIGPTRARCLAKLRQAASQPLGAPEHGQDTV